MPLEVPSEVLLGGVQLARGYIKRPEQTGVAFVPNPFSPVGEAQFEGRLYRTGDSMLQRTDGQLVYLGRIDNQVKLNGLRIELGEIEAALQEVSGVTTAVVHLLRKTSG